MRVFLTTILGLLVAVLLLTKPLLGFSPFAIGSLFAMASGLGAKLACSGRYLTGLSSDQVLADLASYSPVYGLVEISYDDELQVVTADLLGMGSSSASYRPGLGCTLNIGDVRALDSVIVGAVPTSSAAWPLGEAIHTIVPGYQQQLDTLLVEDNAAGYESRALLVVQRGQIIAESYAEPYAPETPHLGWSMGKSLTALLLGRLEYQGRLAMDETGLFPEWENDDRREIDVESLLHMASGLRFEEVYAPGSDATRMLFNSHSASAVALAEPLQHSPGEHFSYSSGTTNLLTRLFQQRVGGSTQQSVDYLYAQLLEPMAMAHTTLEPDPSGVFVGSSYIYASARDWARLGLLMAQGGELNGQRLVSSDWVARAATPSGALNDARYGYQFWLNSGGEVLRWPDLPADAYAMRGNRSQVVMIIPSEELVLVRLGWSVGGYPTSTNFGALVSSARKQSVAIR